MEVGRPCCTAHGWQVFNGHAGLVAGRGESPLGETSDQMGGPYCQICANEEVQMERACERSGRLGRARTGIRKQDLVEGARRENRPNSSVGFFEAGLRPHLTFLRSVFLFCWPLQPRRERESRLDRQWFSSASPL